MINQNFQLPNSIVEDATKYFGSALLHQCQRLLRQNKVSISFKKGSVETYYIVSGLVRDDRSHECKVVYKNRLEGTPEGPISTNCDCHHWLQENKCIHTTALFCAYHLQNFNDSNHNFNSDLDSNSPPILLDSTLAVNVAEYGTILNGPHQLIGAGNAPTYSSLQYLLHTKKITPFPIPENFRGKLCLFLNHDNKVKVKWFDGDEAVVSEVSVFENLYLFNWKSGKAFHLPSNLKILIQRIRLNIFHYSINDILLNIQELNILDLVEIYIDERPIRELELIEPKMRMTIKPAEKKGLLHVELQCFDDKERLVSPPEFLSYLNYTHGILGQFKKKQDAYDFINSIASAFERNDENYKKLIVSSNKKVKVQQLISEIQNAKHTFLYDNSNNIICSYDNFKIKEIFLQIIKNFSEQFFRYVNFSTEEMILKYDTSPASIFQGLSDFYKYASVHGLEIYYDRNEISKWNSRIKFERRSSSTKWFDLELNIDQDDLDLIKEADLETGIVITKKGLILLSKEQKDLVRFMQKYTKYEATNEQTIIDGSKQLKKFILPFNRARVFELFELRKLGIDGALTEEDIKLCEKLATLEEIPKYDIPKNLIGILRPYQETGFHWLSFLYENKLGACLADDMGLGKTLQTISFLQSIYDKIDRVLIVCPVTILLNWEKEIQKFSNMSLAIYHGGSRSIPNDKKIILTSYGVMKKESEAVFSGINFDILILDEVQHLKNVRSLGAFSARKINANFRVCLTGTPVENDLSEFYNILDLSIPGIWGDLQFVRAVSNTKTRLIARKTASPFILRRTKAQVLHDLPPKIENNIYLDFSDTEKQKYQENLISIRSKINQSTSTAKYGEILKGLLQLRQNCLWQGNHHNITNHIESTKIEFLLETLEAILEEGHQAIVFSQFTTYLDIIQHHFYEKHWKFSRIDGSQSINKRQDQVDLFQSGKNPLFLISLKAGGVGLNLTAASYVFIMDPWWNPAVESQAIDRAHRIGQKNTLTVYRPIIKNSVEEKVLKLQEEKKQLFSDLLASDDDHTFSGKLSMKDFESLFN